MRQYEFKVANLEESNWYWLAAVAFEEGGYLFREHLIFEFRVKIWPHKGVSRKFDHRYV